MLLLSLPMFCCLGTLVVALSTGSVTERALQKELEEARREGMPLEFGDVIEPEPPESQNAAPIYEKAFPLLAAAEKALGEISPRQIEDGTKVSEARSLLDRQREVFDLLEAAASRPRCSFPRDWQRHVHFEFREFVPMKNAVKLLALKARYENVSGEPRKALATLKTAMKVAEHSGQDPVLIALLVRISTETMAIRAVEPILSRNKNNRAVLREVDAFLSSMPPLPNFRSHAEGEIPFGRAVIRGLKSMKELEGFQYGEEPEEASGLEEAVVSSKFFKQSVERKYIATWRSAFREFPENGRYWEGFQKVMAALDRRVEADESAFGRISSTFFSFFEPSTLALGQLETRRKLLQAATKILLVSNGTPPNNLPELGELGVDPFSKNSFGYRRAGNGLVIYSVGQDRTDEGGRLPGTNVKITDIVLHIK